MNNLVTISGRLTKDPEIKYFESGKCKTEFTIAVDNFVDKQKLTSFINCEIWDKQAEFVSEYFKKGINVYATGELKYSEYNGKAYYKVNCQKTGFTGCNFFIKGKATLQNGTAKITTSENAFVEAKCYNKELPTDEKVYCLTMYLKDYKPCYVVESFM